jgi:hypothetical protein
MLLKPFVKYRIYIVEWVRGDPPPFLFNYTTKKRFLEGTIRWKA